jgi:hypothetical protein
VLASRGAVDRVPLVATAPLQPSEALHEVASVVDQASVDAAPAATLNGFTVRFTVGGCAAAGEVTFTVTLFCPRPPGPEQLKVKVLLPVSAAVLSLPDGDRLPDQSPDAEQVVALVEDHVSSTLAPSTTESADEAIETVCAGVVGLGAPASVDAPPPHALNDRSTLKVAARAAGRVGAGCCSTSAERPCLNRPGVNTPDRALRATYC